MRKPNKEELVMPQPLLIIAAAAQIGLLQIFAQSPFTAEAAAQKISADKRAVWTICEALCSLGYLQKEDSKYSYTAEASEMLYNEASPQYVGFSFMHAYQLMKNWLQLPEVIKGGKPVPRTQEHIPHFMGAMTHYAKAVAPQIVPVVLKSMPEGIDILDIGGGPGIYAREFAKHGAKVTILDEKPIVEMMAPKLDTSAIVYEAGDFNVALPKGPFDLAYLGNITHILDEEGNKALFKKVYQSLKMQGKIVILDILRDMSTRGALFAVNMLVNTKHGGTWTKAEYTQWLEESGFGEIEVINLNERQLVTGTKK